MGNAYIGYPDWSASAIFTASAESSSFPATNLNKNHPRQRYENTSPSSFYVEADSGSTANTVKAVFVPYCNADSGATWRIRSADTQAGLTSAPDVDTNILEGGLMTFWSATDYVDGSNAIHGLYIFDTSFTNRWLRFDFADWVSDPVRMGSIMVSGDDPLGNNNIHYGSDFGGYVDRGGVGQTALGRLTGSQGFRARQFNMQGVLTQQADVETMMKIYEQSGGTRNVIFARDREETTRMAQGAISGWLPRSIRWGHSNFQQHPFRTVIAER